MMKFNNENLAATRKQLALEEAVVPNSAAAARLHTERINQLNRTILNWNDNKEAQRVSNFDPSAGVKFTDQNGTELPFEVKPTWVDQTKVGVTRLEYKVTLPNSEVRKYERRVRVSKYEVQAFGISDLQVPAK